MKLKSRWHSFAVVLLAASLAGTPYAFGIFSEIFKKELGYSQLDLSIIGSCGSSGLYTGVVWGLALERFGPSKVLLCGSLLVAFGNLYVWLAVQRIVWHGVPILSFAYVIAQLGIAATTMTATALSIRIFPSIVTGQVTGLAKGYFGVSSAVLATISAGFFKTGDINFILFVALFIPGVLIFASFNVSE